MEAKKKGLFIEGKKKEKFVSSLFCYPADRRSHPWGEV